MSVSDLRSAFLGGGLSTVFGDVQRTSSHLDRRWGAQTRIRLRSEEFRTRSISDFDGS